jgi:hypothetical protein
VTDTHPIPSQPFPPAFNTEIYLKITDVRPFCRKLGEIVEIWKKSIPRKKQLP